MDEDEWIEMDGWREMEMETDGDEDGGGWIEMDGWK